MNLASWGFAAGFGAVALLLVVACTAWLSRGRPSLGDRLRRGVAAVLAGVLVLLVMVVNENATLGWVKRPSDVTGMISAVLSPSQPNVDVVPVAQFDQPWTDTDSPWADAPLPANVAPASGENAQGAWLKQGKNGVWTGRVHGARSGLTQDVTVWTPPGFDPASSQTYRVVVFLHGYPGSDRGPVDALHVARTFEALVKHHLMEPTIFVVPDLSVGGAPPDCVDIAGRPHVETLVTQDLVAALRGQFPNLSDDRQGWALAGISAGAYCAPVLAMRHQATFSAAIAMGAYDPPELGALASGDQQARDAFTVSTMVRAADAPVALYIAGTDNDPDSLQVVQNVEAVASGGDAVATLLQPSGGHSWTAWATQLPAGLVWWQSQGRILPEQGNRLAAAAGVPVASGQADSGIETTPFGLVGVGTLVAAILAMLGSVGACAACAPRVGGRMVRASRPGGGAGSRVRGPRLGSPLRRGGGLAWFVARFAVVVVCSAVFALAAVIVANWFSGFCVTWAELGEYAGLLFPAL